MQVVEYDLSTIFLFNLALIFQDDIIGHTYFKVSLPNQIADIIFSRQRNISCISKFKCLSSYKTIIQTQQTLDVILDVKYRI